MNRLWIALFALLLVGCAKPSYLKKFDAIVPPRADALKGKSIYIETFKDTANVDEDWEKSKPLDDPKGFELSDVTDEQEDQWEKERDAAADKTDKYYKLGLERNDLGMTVREIESANKPAPWLQDALSKELVAQGATIATSAGDADVVVAGDLVHLNIAYYRGFVCNVVVDLKITPKGGSPKEERIHTKGGDSDVWGGGADPEDTYRVMRKCEELFSVHAIDRIAAAAGSAAPAMDEAPAEGGDEGSEEGGEATEPTSMLEH